MAREFGQLDSATWRDDEDWRALPADAQWLYGLLISQSDLTAAGVLNLAVNRWRHMCADMDAERFMEALTTLEANRFVCVDFDTEELIVRSFARRKTQWTNPKRVGALRSAVAQIHSPLLRQVLSNELHRVEKSVDGLPEPSPDGLPERLTERMPMALVDVSSTTGSSSREETGDARRETQDASEKRGTADASPLNGQLLLKRFLDAFKDKTGAPYPERSKGHLAGQIGVLLKVYDGQTVAKALDRLLERGLGPAKLPDCVADVLNPTPRRQPPPQPVDASGRPIDVSMCYE